MSLEPLVPFVEIPELVLVPAGALGGDLPPAPISIKPFGTLVATGVYLGGWLAVRQARRVGLDHRTTLSFIFWVVVTGFVLGHALDTVFYYPERVVADPLSVVRLWEGLSSFGGFTGAVVGALLWKWRHRQPILPYADVVASAFPTAWVFGRAGCAVAHDHPGVESDWWLAVRYPGGGRLDLGLYEMVLTIPLAVAFLVLRRKPRPWGFFLGASCVAYAPIRFALDFLRTRGSLYLPAYSVPADVRYAGLTPAQWASAALLLAGLGVLWGALGRAGTPEATRVPAPSPKTRPGATRV